MTYWWNSGFASYVDFTDDRAVSWWTQRLLDLQNTTGIDSFKFDAGEANWMPSSFRLTDDSTKAIWPEIFTTKFAETMSSTFGGQIEVRVGRRTQKEAIFVRMLDKFSDWSYANGLKTMVTTLLQQSIAGYPFVLPDMIGGNGYNGDPDKELYIRWLQANTFMPTMQFSYVPWMFDQETVDHALNMTALHAQYAPLIIQLANEATVSGAPINRPIWWNFDEPDAYQVDDEFMLGDSILVAPVLEQGARHRDIYLPAGLWRDEANPSHPLYVGPRWVLSYPADLLTLPWFTLQG